MDELAGQAPCYGISFLGAQQLLEWADGSKSASKLQSVMHAAVQDGLSHPMVSRLSSIHSGQHAHASLMDLLESKTSVLDGIQKVAGCSGDFILKPSSMIARLYSHYPAHFLRHFGC